LGFDAGLNFYVYAGGSPVNLVDPLGLSTGSRQHGLDDHDEMPDGTSRAKRNENGQGNGYSRGTIGKLDNIQDVIDNTRRREEAKKTPDHLNPVMWAKEWAADIMSRQGYPNPFAEPEPKNNVEKQELSFVGLVVDYAKFAWNDIVTGKAQDRAIGAIEAELSMAAGIAELAMSYGSGGLLSGIFGAHGVGNLAGGVGDYLDIFDSGVRDWNVTRSGYEKAAAALGFDESLGTKSFHTIDAVVNVKQMLAPTQVSIHGPLTIKGYYSVPAITRSSPLAVTHDILQVGISVKSGASE
jgi:hypothetical protein